MTVEKLTYPTDDQAGRRVANQVYTTGAKTKEALVPKTARSAAPIGTPVDGIYTVTKSNMTVQREHHTRRLTPSRGRSLWERLGCFELFVCALADSLSRIIFPVIIHLSPTDSRSTRSFRHIFGPAFGLVLRFA